MFVSLLCGTCGPAKDDTSELVESLPNAPSILIGSDSLEPCLPESPEKVVADSLSEQSTRDSSSDSGSAAIGVAAFTLGDANDVQVSEVQRQPSDTSQGSCKAMSSAPLAPKAFQSSGSATGVFLPSGSASRRPHSNFSHSSSGLQGECEALPLPTVPVGLKPLTSQKLLGLDIKSIRASLEVEEGPVQRFMREILGCSDFSTTPWAARRISADVEDGAKKASAATSVFFRRSLYRAAMPSDIPSSVARLVGIPDSVKASFSDRFRLQNTFSFAQEADGVLLSQWAEVIWDKPLPWTHAPVKMFVEKKARAEAKSTFRDFAKIIHDDAS
eukprot:CAMPEP_0169290544 /NCGR_PEP_ID=MMETSP1016-20121227/61754_1 /TAXON_ID=342587 /ORGANISM="Karlodinium micrum, Strain CCMP2283" /LENGTH=328 /DNA_ID=CAMNT_0009381057 /DNA_START=65 /DNA_END=1051 /DNA_ORIENTATION=-